jgi:hypothetical protein
MNQVMGERSVQQFARLYLFPGGYHCGGGEGPFNFDLMSAIMAWVEKGSAPFSLLASHQVGGPHGPIAGVPGGPPPGGLPPGGPPSGGFPPPGQPGMMPPSDGAGRPPVGMPPMRDQGDTGSQGGTAPQVDRTRPVYPYPLTAKYDETGSIDDAKSFSAGPAKPVASTQLQWLGSAFYSPHHEVWCQGEGAA